MRRQLCKSKIHGAVVTEANLYYEGSVTIDRELMDAADLAAYERIQVVNLNNGARFESYVIPGGAGEGRIGLNGAAARLGSVGDRVIIISYGEYEESEVEGHQPRVVFVNEKNRITRGGLRATGS